MNKKHLLVIDDDKDIAEMLSDYLQKNGYRVTIAFHGMALNKLLKEHNFDMAILDVMLPGPDGLSLCQTIRQQHDMPILMLSAAATESDRVAGLELGADDYLAKPFSSRELLARIKAHLRRVSGELAPCHKRLPALGLLQFGPWRLNRETHCLIDPQDVVLSLSQKEYDLLVIFLEHPKRILSRDQLMDLLYDKFSTPIDRAIDVLIARLRKKLEQNPKSPELLLTIRGGGYQLNVPVGQPS